MQSTEEFVRFLGKGDFGSVDLFKYTKSDGSSYHATVKTSEARNYDSLNREFQILSELKGYPNIVICYGDDLEEGLNVNGHKVYKLLLEYATEGSLRSFMDNYTDRRLPDPMIRDFTRMILEGLVSIHSHGYVHCDLKSDNLLIFSCKDSSYVLKISDFGNTREVREVPSHWETDYPFVGTPIYMPPESLHDGAAKKTLDLWSLGCLVLEMYTGRKPWAGVGIFDLMDFLYDGEAPEIPEYVPCDAREFIETCFAREPKKRGNASALMLHRFLCPEEKAEKIVVAVAKEKISLPVKLKLRIRRASKITMDIINKPLKLKIFPSNKPPQFKKLLSKLLRLKTIHPKPLDSNLVSVH
ncbi:PREDICTED: serine/threonine-protein kinase BCK1/SLK1/SSP31-like [Camelina sativa]|uniref:Serine/threonine-protein kinase BCK1/SLK1/SSP31-like n=1 Tax=Camelina sativa TaxID=90675 RepID=A0ABM0VI33_CAMSA|nr:PREDICTED: serine/threonine-protein kinase BCK1/SLK1/SSP31-like [Camelina sativa]